MKLSLFQVPNTPEAAISSPVPEPPPSESNALLEMLKAAQKVKEVSVFFNIAYYPSNL